MLANVSNSDLTLILYLIALVAVGLGLWRGVLRDVVGCVLCLLVAVVAVIIAQ